MVTRTNCAETPEKSPPKKREKKKGREKKKKLNSPDFQMNSFDCAARSPLEVVWNSGGRLSPGLHMNDSSRQLGGKVTWHHKSLVISRGDAAARRQCELVSVRRCWRLRRRQVLAAVNHTHSLSSTLQRPVLLSSDDKAHTPTHTKTPPEITKQSLKRRRKK